MIRTFDLDKMMYRLLVESGVEDYISGGVYMQGERPVDSEMEDIMISHISLTMDAIPQTAYTNVNIYAGDVIANVGGKAMNVVDRERLDSISDVVVKAIEGCRTPGIALRVENMTLVKDGQINQHYVNIRVYWTIAIY